MSGAVGRAGGKIGRDARANLAFSHPTGLRLSREGGGPTAKNVLQITVGAAGSGKSAVKVPSDCHTCTKRHRRGASW